MKALLTYDQAADLTKRIQRVAYSYELNDKINVVTTSPASGKYGVRVSSKEGTASVQFTTAVHPAVALAAIQLLS